jgi:excisionase family DNA binding protein
MASQEHQPTWESLQQDASPIDENIFEPLLSAAQAADLLGGMHVKTLMQMARKRRVPAHKIGRFWYFRASELNDWFNSSCTVSHSGLQSKNRPCLV